MKRLELIAIVLFSSGAGFLIGQHRQDNRPPVPVEAKGCSGIVTYAYVDAQGNESSPTYTDIHGKPLSTADAKAIEQMQGCKL